MSKYKANPVIVDALKIAKVGDPVKASHGEVTSLDGSRLVFLEDGSIQRLTAEMLARYTPVVGDYLVKQEDGYLYVNPAAVFERKYSPVRVYNIEINSVDALLPPDEFWKWFIEPIAAMENNIAEAE